MLLLAARFMTQQLHQEVSNWTFSISYREKKIFNQTKNFPNKYPLIYLFNRIPWWRCRIEQIIHDSFSISKRTNMIPTTFASKSLFSLFSFWQLWGHWNDCAWWCGKHVLKSIYPWISCTRWHCLRTMSAITPCERSVNPKSKQRAEKANSEVNYDVKSIKIWLKKSKITHRWIWNSKACYMKFQPVYQMYDSIVSNHVPAWRWSCSVKFFMNHNYCSNSDTEQYISLNKNLYQIKTKVKIIILDL